MFILLYIPFVKLPYYFIQQGRHYFSKFYVLLTSNFMHQSVRFPPPSNPSPDNPGDFDTILATNSEESDANFQQNIHDIFTLMFSKKAKLW